MGSKSISLFALSLLLAVPMQANAADTGPRASQKLPRSDSDISKADQTLRRATEVYAEIVRERKIPKSILQKANCVAIFPDVVTAALGVGGMHGDGVALCKNASDATARNVANWTNPVFLDLTGGSLGLQAGVKSADVVLFMTGDNAKSTIEKGDFALGGELSAVAGSFDETFTAPPSGIVAYQRSGGVFAGASINGVNVSVDREEQRGMYGSPQAVFDTKMPSRIDATVRELHGHLHSA